MCFKEYVPGRVMQYEKSRENCIVSTVVDKATYEVGIEKQVRVTFSQAQLNRASSYRGADE